MAVPALGDWYACVMVGTKYKRGETLSPTMGETEAEAKARCKSHWQNDKPHPIATPNDPSHGPS
ncbi:MAG: hypothetical protein RLZZ408_146 [Verrucomicrobiota bacterium]|jgi:hypothetical protein